MNTPTRPMRGRTRSQVWTLSVRGQFASADGARLAMPPVRHRLLHRRRHHLCRRRQRMTPIGRAIEECRMQFPRPCVASRIRIVGIATFVDAVESSLSRIACETAPRMCARRTRGPDSPPPDRWAAYPRAPARTRARCRPSSGWLSWRPCTRAHAGPLMRAWAAPPMRIS